MRRIRRGAFGIGLVIAMLVGLVGLSDADPVVNFKTVFATDVAYAGYGGMRGFDGNGTLNVSGVSGTVTEAYLYWHGPTNSPNANANADVIFNGTGITGTQIGFASPNCWSFLNSQAYRADVTSLVGGNGDYSLASFIRPAIADINGVSLIVFYDDGDTTNNRDIVLFDGNDSNQASATDDADWDVTLDDINYTSGSVGVDMHVSDGQNFGDMGLTANATDLVPVGQNWDGNSVPNGPTAGGTNGGLWDIASYDLTSLVSPGPNTIQINTLPGGNDCLSLIVAAVNLPAGSAPNQPPTTTTTVAPVPEPPPAVAAPAAVARPVAARPAFTG